MEGAYLELLSKACLHPRDGLMSAEVWKLDAVRRYLKEESSLLTNIMSLMYLRGGQAPRTTEFWSIEYCNGPRTSRGIYIHRGSLVYVTRHSKARRMMGHVFQIVQYLPKLPQQIQIDTLKDTLLWNLSNKQIPMLKALLLLRRDSAIAPSFLLFVVIHGCCRVVGWK